MNDKERKPRIWWRRTKRTIFGWVPWRCTRCGDYAFVRNTASSYLREESCR